MSGEFPELGGGIWEYDLRRHPLKDVIDSKIAEGMKVAAVTALINELMRNSRRLYGMPTSMRRVLRVTYLDVDQYLKKRNNPFGGLGDDMFSGGESDQPIPLERHSKKHILIEGIRKGWSAGAISDKINFEVAREFTQARTISKWIQKLKEVEGDIHGRLMLTAGNSSIKLTPPKREDEWAYETAFENMRIGTVDAQKSALLAYNQCVKYIDSFGRRPTRGLTNKDHKSIQGYLKEIREWVTALGKMTGALDGDGVLNTVNLLKIMPKLLG